MMLVNLQELIFEENQKTDDFLSAVSLHSALFLQFTLTIISSSCRCVFVPIELLKTHYLVNYLHHQMFS